MGTREKNEETNLGKAMGKHRLLCSPTGQRTRFNLVLGLVGYQNMPLACELLGQVAACSAAPRASTTAACPTSRAPGPTAAPSGGRSETSPRARCGAWGEGRQRPLTIWLVGEIVGDTSVRVQASVLYGDLASTPRFLTSTASMFCKRTSLGWTAWGDFFQGDLGVAGH